MLISQVQMQHQMNHVKKKLMTHKRHVKTKAKGTSMAFNSKIGLGKLKHESVRSTAFICYNCKRFNNVTALYH